MHDRTTNHHPYLLLRADVVHRTWLEPQSRSSPTTPFSTVAKHTTSRLLFPFPLLRSPSSTPFSPCMYLRTYVRTSPRTLVSLQPNPPSGPLLYLPLRGSHDSGRNMQIREINARKFHYNSTRKISSSSCTPPRDRPGTPFFLTAPCNHFSLARLHTHERSGGPRTLLAILSGRQEHPHYLVFPHSPWKMVEKVAGKTVRRRRLDRTKMASAS